MTIKFAYVDVKDEVVKILKPEFEPLNIRVIKSDPREQIEIPCIGINRAGDDEQNSMLSDDAGTVYDPETNTYVKFKGTFFNETIEARLWHTNADERDRLYILLKALLFDMRDGLAQKGLRNVVLRGGRDEQENNIAPQPIYFATVTMNYLNPLDVQASVEPPIGVGETIIEVVQHLKGM